MGLRIEEVDLERRKRYDGRNAAIQAGWRLVRVDSTLRAIFRAAVFELMERIDVPARVVINDK